MKEGGGEKALLEYGRLDASYRAAGQLSGIEKLVRAFYRYMDTEVVAGKIRKMHAEDLQLSIEKLSLFLCGWLGGPRLFQAKFGGINIPGVHSHLPIDVEARDAWLFCMAKALEEQDYSEAFKKYLLEQLAIPAERVRQAAEKACR